MEVIDAVGARFHDTFPGLGIDAGERGNFFYFALNLKNTLTPHRLSKWGKPHPRMPKLFTVVTLLGPTVLT